MTYSDDFPARRFTGVVAAAFFLDSFLYAMLIPMLPYFASKYGLTNAEVGALFASYAGANLAVTVLAGAWADRLGCRRVFLAGASCLGGATLLFALADGFAVLLFCRVLQGAGAGATYVAGYASIGLYLPTTERGKAVAQASSGIALGVLLGPPVAGALLDVSGPMLPFLLCAAAVVGEVGAIAALLPRDVDTPSMAKTTDGGLHRIDRNVVILWLLPAFLAGFGLTGIDSTLPRDLLDRVVASNAAVGLLLAIVAVGYLLGAQLGGRVSDRTGRPPVLIAGWVVGASTIALIGLPSTVVAQGALMLLAGFGLGMMVVTIAPAISDRLDSPGESRQGAGAAAYNFSFTVGMMLGAPCVGWWVDAYSFSAAMLLLAGVLVMGLGARTLGSRTLEKVIPRFPANSRILPGSRARNAS